MLKFFVQFSDAMDISEGTNLMLLNTIQIVKVVADFRESSALSDPSERRKLQTQTLTAVFETYFRILKSSLDPTNRLICVPCVIYINV